MLIDLNCLLALDFITSLLFQHSDTEPHHSCCNKIGDCKGAQMGNTVSLLKHPLRYLGERIEKKKKKIRQNSHKTYNTEDSLVVTDPTTNSALTSLSMREQTGPRVLQWLWSYVEV